MTAHEVWGVIKVGGSNVSLDQPQWVSVYDPLARGGIRSN